MKFTPLASSSRGNAYLLQGDGVSPLLLEAGLPIKQLRDKLREHGVSLSDLAGCLVSHEHQDHAKAVKDLLLHGIDCYMSPGTAIALEVEKHHRAHPLFLDMTEGIQLWRVISFPLEHDATEPIGFFIGHGKERLLFVADTGYVMVRFSGITLAAIECNFQDEILHENIVGDHISGVVGRRVRRLHMSLENVKKFLLANDLSQAREIWLLHLSSSNSDEESMKREIQEAIGVPVYIAEE